VAHARWLFLFGRISTRNSFAHHADASLSSRRMNRNRVILLYTIVCTLHVCTTLLSAVCITSSTRNSSQEFLPFIALSFSLRYVFPSFSPSRRIASRIACTFVGTDSAVRFVNERRMNETPRPSVHPACVSPFKSAFSAKRIRASCARRVKYSQASRVAAKVASDESCRGLKKKKRRNRSSGKEHP